MDSHMAGVARCSNKHGSCFSWHSRKLESEIIHRLPCNVVACNMRKGSQRSRFLHHASIGKYPTRHPSWRMFSVHVGLEDEPSSSPKNYSSDNDELANEDSSEGVLPQHLDSDKLKSLLADVERSKLIKKLSEANQLNRFLKRQLQVKEDALVNFKSELAVMELEVQSLVTLAEEIAKSSIQPGSRKINGKYIQSHLLSRLQAVDEKLKEQIKGVDAVKSKEVPLSWYGMAESVQVMGSFDGWSQGEHLSQEYTGSVNKFSTTLMLRPGRFKVFGEMDHADDFDF